MGTMIEYLDDELVEVQGVYWANERLLGCYVWEEDNEEQDN